MQQTRQSNGTGLALLWDKEGEGGGEGGEGGQHSKAGNRQTDKKQRSDTPPTPLFASTWTSPPMGSMEI